MGIVADIERQLSRQRARQREDGVPELRLSTMTHLVWAPPKWLDRARATLHGLQERHPARTILLVPEPRSKGGLKATALVRDFEVGEDREVLSEIIEVRLGGAAAEHPASIVLPLLVSDLPVFCRWRGEPEWTGNAFRELVDLCDRLVVDSGEWTSPLEGYGRVQSIFGTVAVSDLAYRRSLGWRARLADLWPGIRSAESVRIDGPTAEAVLVAGWLRSQLRRRIELVQRNGERITGVAVDGVPVQRPSGKGPTGSELLSAELELLHRDPVYEAAVKAARRVDR
jgi:glucose-6-phosphate dehydrogenase assembly protein OpcA